MGMQSHWLPSGTRGLPHTYFYSTDYDLLRRLWIETEGIRTVADLKRYVEEHMHSPTVRLLILGAIDYFSRSKILPDGKIDQAMLREHREMGCGRRIQPLGRLTDDAWLGITKWIREGPGQDIGIGLPAEPLGADRFIHDPHAIALDILKLIDSHLCCESAE
ncbi:MAG: hypothetical protein QOE22_46 [Candidatus Parcubacteria bacterium]|jgi:hypothetical protein|nr:hypothetical protein [Candidatus Parcubacteria bacterium]